MPASKSRAARANPAAARSEPRLDEAVPAARRIDARIAELVDWRGPMLATLRDLIRGADARIVEEWKWDVPVWSCSGIICTGEVYKMAVKLTFAKGASLPDPSRLFNSSLEGNVRRAIDVREGARPDAAALQRLVRAAIALNLSKGKRGEGAG